MTDFTHSEELGEELGRNGVDQVGEICTHERRRIELSNEPDIVRLEIELATWADEERRISEKLRLAPPSGDLRSRRREARLSLGVTLVLTVAGFFFTLLAFAPFRMGSKSYLYCLGIAIACPYGVHKFLKEWDCRRMIKGLAAVAAMSAVISLVLLAVVRGSLFVQELKQSEAQIVVTDDGPQSAQDDTDFYKNTLPILQLAMALLAVAMELEAGLALHDAKRLTEDSGEDPEALVQNRIAMRMQMAATAAQLVARSNEGAVFEERFWSHFHRAVIARARRKALGRLIAVALVASLAGAAVTRAEAPPANLVVAIDLSASVATMGSDGKTDFEKNVMAISALLNNVPAGSRVTIIGITQDSFAEPDILLSAKLNGDPGYFGERLGAAHRLMIQSWRKRAAELSPTFKQTDILGALLVAGQIFQRAPDTKTKVLVIYSDMRQNTRALNLEGQTSIAAGPTLIRIGKNKPDLKNVQAFLLGVDAAGKDPAYWATLRQFWTAYLESTGATVRTYSILRDSPSL